MLTPKPFTEDENVTDANLSSVKSLVQVTVRASFSGLACDQGATPQGNVSSGQW